MQEILKSLKRKNWLELTSTSLFQGSFIKAYLYVTFYKCVAQREIWVDNTSTQISGDATVLWIDKQPHLVALILNVNNSAFGFYLVSDIVFNLDVYNIDGIFEY